MLDPLNPAFEFVSDDEYELMSEDERADYIIRKRNTARRMFHKGDRVVFSSPFEGKRGAFEFPTSSIEMSCDQEYEFYHSDNLIVEDVDCEGDVMCRISGNPDYEYIDPRCLFTVDDAIKYNIRGMGELIGDEICDCEPSERFIAGF